MVGIFVDGIAEFYNETDGMIRWGVTRVDCDLLEDRLFFSISFLLRVLIGNSESLQYLFSALN